MSGRPGFETFQIRRSTNQLACDVGDEKVLLQTASGEYLGLNAVGAFLWDALAEPKRGSELVDLVVQHYDVDAAQALIDVHDFMNELAHAGLVDIG
jgi:hypothetical protein